MEFWLLTIASLLLSAIAFFGSGRSGRNLLFYIFWIPGNLAILTAIFLYMSVPLFDQDLMAFPYYKISIIIAMGALIVSQIAAIILGKTSLYAELAEERQQRAISEITQVAVSSTSLMELLNFTLDKIVKMLGMSAGIIHIYHRARQNLVLGSYTGLSARLVRRLETVDFGDTAIGRTARNKRLLIIRNLRLSPDYEAFGGKSEGFTYLALIPIISEGEHWGVITLFGRGNYHPGQLQVDLLEQFGEQLGAALVLGRQMRTTQSSLDSMKALIGALGDELYAGTKLRDSIGLGTVRGIAWSLTRILSGDRFDICRKTDSGWITSLSSEPGADGRGVNIDSDSEFAKNPSPSGIIGWDQTPPFKEFMERRPYIFCALPDKQSWMFVRLESRRRMSFDFDFFYDACRIIFGLFSIVGIKREGFASGTAPREIAKFERAETGIGESAAEIAGAFDKISHDLEKLIEEYSANGVSEDLQGLLGWLYVIRKSAAEGREIIDSVTSAENTVPPKAAAGQFPDFVSKAIDEVNRNREVPINIEVGDFDKSITLKRPAEEISRIITGFLGLAASGAQTSGTMKFNLDRSDNSTVLKLTGEKIPAHRGPRPRWVNDIGGRLEFSKEKTESGSSIDGWKLVIPDNLPSPADSDREIKILGVDTRDIIRDLLSGMLDQLGYQFQIVDSSSQAMHLFEQGIVSGDRFDIIIADNALDEISGMEMATRMKQIDPDIFFLLTPGWGMEPDPAIATQNGVDFVLEKPFRLEQLATILSDAEKRLLPK